MGHAVRSDSSASISVRLHNQNNRRKPINRFGAALLCAFLLLTGSQTLLSQVTAPTEPVGTASATQTATIQLSSNFTLGSISVLIQGAPGLDFNLASGGSCAVGASYTAGQTCTVNYTFTPTKPGNRMGAIVLFDNTTPTPVRPIDNLPHGHGQRANGGL